MWKRGECRKGRRDAQTNNRIALSSFKKLVRAEQFGKCANYDWGVDRALRGQADVPTVQLYQLNSEMTFQYAQLMTDCGGRHLEEFRCQPDSAQAGYGLERSKACQRRQRKFWFVHGRIGPSSQRSFPTVKVSKFMGRICQELQRATATRSTSSEKSKCRYRDLWKQIVSRLVAAPVLRPAGAFSGTSQWPVTATDLKFRRFA